MKLIDIIIAIVIITMGAFGFADWFLVSNDIDPNAFHTENWSDLHFYSVMIFLAFIISRATTILLNLIYKQQ